MALFKEYEVSQTSTGTVDFGKLSSVIKNSSISVDLRSIDPVDKPMTKFRAYFKSDLTAGDITELYSIVTTHDGDPDSESFTVIQNGAILMSPDNSEWKLTIDDDGIITTTKI